MLLRLCSGCSYLQTSGEKACNTSVLLTPGENWVPSAIINQKLLVKTSASYTVFSIPPFSWSFPQSHIGKNLITCLLTYTINYCLHWYCSKRLNLNVKKIPVPLIMFAYLSLHQDKWLQWREMIVFGLASLQTNGKYYRYNLYCKLPWS